MEAPHAADAGLSSTSSVSLTDPYDQQKDNPSVRPYRPRHHRTQSQEFIAAHSRKTGNSNLEPPVMHHPDVSTDTHAPLTDADTSTQTYVKGKSLLDGLIKPPTVRQFLHNGKFYRETGERSQSHFELFADLVFVGIVHILGEVAAEEATILNAAKFTLLFWPPWSVWSDMRSYINISGTDDAVQRLYILGTAFLLVGYTANASAVEVQRVSEEGDVQVHIPEESFDTLRAAVSFFLVAKALRICLYFVYAFYLPKFRLSHLMESCFTILSLAIFIPIFFLHSPGAIITLICIGIVANVASRYCSAIAIHWAVDMRREKNDVYVPAISISHVIERTTAFLVLIVGETLINISYVADEESIGVSPAFGRSALGMTIAFFVCWIYFDSDSARVFVHALRRHWFSSVSYTQIHLPLCGGLIIVSAALHEMVLEGHAHPGITWYFCGGMAVVMLCLGTIGFLHKSLDQPGSGVAPRWARLLLRFAAGVLFTVLPLFGIESNTAIMGIHVGVLAFIVVAETLSKLGTVGHRIEHKHHHPHVPFVHHTHPHHPVPPASQEPGTADQIELDAFRTGAKVFRSADLTPYEKGEEDVGGDERVGILRATTVRRGQRTAFAAL